MIPVDLFGLPADYRRILPIAEAHGLKVLEDGAQGFGGTLDGKTACAFGDASTTSFSRQSRWDAMGTAAQCSRDDDTLAGLLQSIRIHGKGSEKYDNVRVGIEFPAGYAPAAILQPKLAAFSAYELAARQKWAEAYSERLSGAVKTPAVPEGFSSSWAQYTLLWKAMRKGKPEGQLAAAGVPSMVHYPRLLHRQTVYLPLGYEAAACRFRKAGGARAEPSHASLSHGRDCGSRLRGCVEKSVRQGGIPLANFVYLTAVLSYSLALGMFWHKLLRLTPEEGVALGMA